MAAVVRSSVSAATVMASSPAHVTEAPVPRKSKRCVSSLAAWLRALSTSWRSTFETTSNDGLATALLLGGRGRRCPRASGLHPPPGAHRAGGGLYYFHRHRHGGLPERAMGADCKSVAKASQ